jgi:diguanylate cyclase (GGDEF)-like protein
LVPAGERNSERNRERRAASGQQPATGTEQQRTLEERRDEVAAICAAFHALEEGVLISDHRGVVVAANPASARIMGVPLDQILGGSPTHAAAINARFRGGPVITGENSAALRVLHTGEPERGLLVEFSDPGTGETRLIRASVQPLVDPGEATPWGVVSSIVDITERERVLSDLAFRDALTGLPNRRELERHLELAVARAQRTDVRLGVLFFDVDGLKRVNDTLGHGAGDALLRGIAERLIAIIRPTDLLARQERADSVVGRFGGDEFLLLLADLRGDAQAALEQVAERVHDCLSEPFALGGDQLKATVSLGMSLYPEDGTTGGELLARADADMYANKRGGQDPLGAS